MVVAISPSSSCMVIGIYSFPCVSYGGGTEKDIDGEFEEGSNNLLLLFITDSGGGGGGIEGILGRCCNVKSS